MSHIPRIIEKSIHQSLDRGKGILLLGPRQTGKTTLVVEQLKPDIQYSFARLDTRARYEKNPALLEAEIEEKIKSYKKPPLIFIDEVQKIPSIVDIAQHLMDAKLAQFILTGSSARKLKTSKHINWLPGRVVVHSMTPLLYDELPDPKISLSDILLYGTLPGIINTPVEFRETDLQSYVSTYLEEEVRREALVRNVGHFSRFLELAAGESGKLLNFTRLAQDVGISDTTIANYFQILEDCLLLHRIDPITNSRTKRRLMKAPKYLFFDLGVRRAAAYEGSHLPIKIMADLFEHYVGLELINHATLSPIAIKVRYWRDHSGPEIDFVLEKEKTYFPIEVKWTDKPNNSDTKHLRKFLEEYPEAKEGYIICQTPEVYKISDNIYAIPWQKIGGLF